MLTVQNVVATGDVGPRLPLLTISQRLTNAVYNPSKFKAVILRLRSPRTTVLLFASGKIVITGAKTEMDSLAAGRLTARRLRRLGLPAKLSNHTVQMMAASFNLGRRIRIEEFHAEHRARSRLEPEIFAGLIYKMGKTTALVFHTGKGIITGAKKRSDLMNDFDILSTELNSFTF